MNTALTPQETSRWLRGLWERCWLFSRTKRRPMMSKRHIILAAAVAALLTAGCTNEKASIRVLESAGYTQIKMGGYGWFACGEDDIFATKFSAVGPNGHLVTGVVCAGWFKGNTIRID